MSIVDRSSSAISESTRKGDVGGEGSHSSPSVKLFATEAVKESEDEDEDGLEYEAAEWYRALAVNR